MNDKEKQKKKLEEAAYLVAIHVFPLMDSEELIMELADEEEEEEKERR